MRPMLVLVYAVAALLLLWCSPAGASYPQTRCDHETVGGVVGLPDGERWRCEYDPELDDYFWVPLPPMVLPTDTLIHHRASWTAPDGVIHHVRPRLEWINDVLHSGSDVHLRSPLTAPFSVPAGHVKVYSQIFSHDGNSWSLCGDSGWVASTADGSSSTPTFTWGTAPCGARWYTAVAYVERWDGLQWLMNPDAATLDGGTALGDPDLVGDGVLWDAPRGDNRKPKKKPKKMPRPEAPASTSPPPPMTAAFE